MDRSSILRTSTISESVEFYFVRNEFALYKDSRVANAALVVLFENKISITKVERVLHGAAVLLATRRRAEYRKSKGFVGVFVYRAIFGTVTMLKIATCL